MAVTRERDQRRRRQQRSSGPIAARIIPSGRIRSTAGRRRRRRACRSKPDAQRSGADLGDGRVAVPVDRTVANPSHAHRGREHTQRVAHKGLRLGVGGAPRRLWSGAWASRARSCWRRSSRPIERVGEYRGRPIRAHPVIASRYGRMTQVLPSARAASARPMCATSRQARKRRRCPDPGWSRPGWLAG